MTVAGIARKHVRQGNLLKARADVGPSTYDSLLVDSLAEIVLATTSFSLLRRIQVGGHEEAAWQRFVELYAPLIYYWGRGQGLTTTDAAELVQDVMAILVVKLPEFRYDPAQRFRGWLRTITVNKARDLHRRNALRPAVGQDVALADVADSNASDLLEAREYRHFLAQRTLQLLQAEFDRQVWQAFWKQVVDGEKPAEIARELGMTVNSVYLAKSRVLRHLRTELAGLMD